MLTRTNQKKKRNSKGRNCLKRSVPRRVVGISGRKMCTEIIPIVCCLVLNKGLVQRRPKASYTIVVKVPEIL